MQYRSGSHLRQPAGHAVLAARRRQPQTRSPTSPPPAAGWRSPPPRQARSSGCSLQRRLRARRRFSMNRP